MHSFIGPIQNASLPENTRSGHYNEQQRSNFNIALYAILSGRSCSRLAFCFITVSVNESRNSGYAFLYLLAAWPTIFAAVGVFLIGVLGWHTLDPLNRRSENVGIKAIILPELENSAT